MEALFQRNLHTNTTAIKRRFYQKQKNSNIRGTLQSCVVVTDSVNQSALGLANFKIVTKDINRCAIEIGGATFSEYCTVKD